MNKNTWIVVVLLSLLLLIAVISFQLERSDLADIKERLASAQIEIDFDDKAVMMTMSELQLLGTEDFEAVLDTATTKATTKKYTGIELKKVLEHLGIDLSQKKAILLKAADGYSVVYGMDEVLKEKNIYIAFMEEGKYLDTREKGGRGPYESIIVSDAFSNRRCKWLIGIEVKE